MKNIVKYLGAAVAVLALAVACEPKEPVVEVTPEFPSVVENNNVLPGETLTLSFVPNMDWTVRIPEESIKWYSIIDGTFETDFISGKASETPVEVKVKVSEVEEFDSARACEITLTMGGETKVIAKFSRQPKERTIAVFAAEVNGDEFVFGGEDGGYVDVLLPGIFAVKN